MIKKVTLLIAIMFMALFTANAQTEKGTILAGGSVGFDSYTPKGGDAYSTINISPVGGLFLTDGFALGVGVNYLNVDGEDSYGVGPFARYYFGKTNVFGQAGYTFMNDKQSSVGLKAGYAAFLNEHVALEPALTYTIDSHDGDNTGSGIGLSVGFQIHLSK